MMVLYATYRLTYNILNYITKIFTLGKLIYFFYNFDSDFDSEKFLDFSNLKIKNFANTNRDMFCSSILYLCSFLTFTYTLFSKFCIYLPRIGFRSYPTSSLSWNMDGGNCEGFWMKLEGILKIYRIGECPHPSRFPAIHISVSYPIELSYQFPVHF